MTSNEPDDGSGEVDGGEEVASGFVVAGGDGAIQFQLGEEIFNQMPRFVEILVIFALDLAVGLGRNYGPLACLRQRNQRPLIGLEAFVGKQDIGLHQRQQGIGSLQIAGLSRRKMKPGRVAQGVDRGMDFGAQSALAAPDGLVRTPFLRAPALC